MALKLSSIAADISTENDGEWIEIEEWPGVKLLVRSINYKAYQNAREMRLRKMTAALGRAPFGTEFAPVVAELAAAHLLLGWDGIVGDDEAPIEYSRAKGIEMLTDQKYRALVSQTIWAATRVGDREAEFTETAAKNSEAPSATI